MSNHSYIYELGRGWYSSDETFTGLIDFYPDVTKELSTFVTKVEIHPKRFSITYKSGIVLFYDEMKKIVEKLTNDY